ncbi:MAG: rhodanese-like domain-containing protein [Polyangiales bacterium]
MADIKRVPPAEAQRLVDEEGYVYVDVRSVPEFEAEHPIGAANVPLMNAGPGGMEPNRDFLGVMSATFPKDAKLVLGCKSGNRSLRAANVLVQQGWTHVVDQRAGFEGARDPFGQLTEQGWKAAGLPVTSGDGGDKSYAKLKK